MRRRTTWLDALVYRFQHHWETSPQYRAASAGVAGLVLVLLMCSCMGVVSLTANSALAGIGLLGSGDSGGSGNTGTNRLTSAQAIPTNTVGSYTAPAIPVTTIPTSQTPIPTPTDPPTPTPTATATPCQGNCNGGGGGGGGGGSVSASASPTPWQGGQGAQVSVHSSAPYTGINIIINFSNGVTVLNNGQGQTDASGNYTYSFTVPSGVSGNASIVIMASSGAGTTLHQPCA